MTPSGFTDANQTWGGPEYLDLPVFNDGTQLLSCWRMSWRERLSAVLFGRVWLSIQGQTQPPVMVWAMRTGLTTDPG